jgi:GNAT superfamily N-acetyltransferase
MNEPVALSISQFIDAWRIFGRGHAGSRTESAAGVTYVFTGLPIAFFNIAVPAVGPLSAAALEATARGAMHWASDSAPPWLFVVTHPSHQKKGFAEAAMRHALSVAAERFGERPTFLHATDAGRPIYARMGYEPVATHTCFIDKRFLAGH